MVTTPVVSAPPSSSCAVVERRVRSCRALRTASAPPASRVISVGMSHSFRSPVAETVKSKSPRAAMAEPNAEPVTNTARRRISVRPTSRSVVAAMRDADDDRQDGDGRAQHDGCVLEGDDGEGLVDPHPGEQRRNAGASRRCCRRAVRCRCGRRRCSRGGGRVTRQVAVDGHLLGRMADRYERRSRRPALGTEGSLVPEMESALCAEHDGASPLVRTTARQRPRVVSSRGDRRPEVIRHESAAQRNARIVTCWCSPQPRHDATPANADGARGGSHDPPRGDARSSRQRPRPVGAR